MSRQDTVVLSVFLVGKTSDELKELIKGLAERGAALTIGTEVREIEGKPGLSSINYVQGCDQPYGGGLIRVVEGQVWAGPKHQGLIEGMLRREGIAYSEVFVKIEKSEIEANVAEPLPVSSGQASVIFNPCEPVSLVTTKK